MLRNKRHVYGEGSVKLPHHMNYGQEILDRMMEHGDQVALVIADTGDTVTFRELAQKTVDIALSLSRLGVGKGDVIATCTDKRIEAVPSILGIFCSGATYVDHPMSDDPDLHHYKCNITRPKIFFCSPNAYDLHKKTFDRVGCVEKYIIYGDGSEDGGQYGSQDGGQDSIILFKDFVTDTAPVSEFMAAPVDGKKDILWIVFSSGTTGSVKGVPRTHSDFLYISTTCGSDSFRRSSILIASQDYRSSGVRFTFSFLEAGCTVVVCQKDRGNDLVWLDVVEKYKIKYIHGHEILVRKVIKSSTLDQYDLTSLEGLFVVGSPIMAQQIADVKKRLPNLKDVYQIYGMSEASGLCNKVFALDANNGSVGRPTPGVVMKVIDLHTRQLLGPNQRGEICLKSPSLTKECLGNKTLTINEEGFFVTGDYGYYDQERCLYVINRVSDIIYVDGRLICPVELESVLLCHPAVTDVAVSDSGAGLVASVMMSQEITASVEEIRDYLISRVPDIQTIEVREVTSLPRIGGIKLNRVILKRVLSCKS